MSFLRPPIFYANENARSPLHFALYWEIFFDRRILPCVKVNPCDFNPYDLSPGSLIASLGWGSFVLNGRTLFFPDVVRKFYVNLKLEVSSTLCGVFSTYIDG
ncbi:hypothetical protein LINGRAHAP2_LOCUS31519, partial [Linum grandiflorum]